MDAPDSSPAITLVIGMHRSGTSLCAHMLSVLGVDMADDVGADGSNARGHWERAELVALHDEVLRLFARGWYDERHGFALPAGWWADPRVRKIRDRITDWLAPRLQRRRQLGFKDPRAARLLPMWHEVCRDLGAAPRFVLCLREPGQVMRSLAARDEIAPPDAEYRWLAYNAHAVEGIGARPACVLPYEDWFPDPARNLARLIRHCSPVAGNPGEGSWAAADPLLLRAAGELVDAGLRHDAVAEAARPHPASRDFHRLLRDHADADGFDPALRSLAGAFIGFEQLIAPIQAAAARLPETVRRLTEQETTLAAARARESELDAAVAALLTKPASAA